MIYLLNSTISIPSNGLSKIPLSKEDGKTFLAFTQVNADVDVLFYDTSGSVHVATGKLKNDNKFYIEVSETFDASDDFIMVGEEATEVISGTKRRIFKLKRGGTPFYIVKG